MDAAAEDADVKLYKASAELLGEFRAKLPLLLKSLKGSTRRLVLHHKTNELLRLVSLQSKTSKLSVLTVSEA